MAADSISRNPTEFERYNYLRIDNTGLAATEAARLIAERFGLGVE